MQMTVRQVFAPLRMQVVSPLRRMKQLNSGACQNRLLQKAQLTRSCLQEKLQKRLNASAKTKSCSNTLPVMEMEKIPKQQPANWRIYFNSFANPQASIFLNTKKTPLKDAL